MGLYKRNEIAYILLTNIIYIVADIHEFAFVTAIDCIGVPNSDLEHVFMYKSVKDICKDVSEFFRIDMCHVHPIANYAEEDLTNMAKNTMSLMALWDVVKTGKLEIEQRYEQAF